jgi:hypothetical protein
MVQEVENAGFQRARREAPRRHETKKRGLFLSGVT